MNKTEALMKNLLYEKVAVIHAAYEDVPETVAFVEVKKDATTAEKLETAFMKTNSINKLRCLKCGRCEERALNSAISESWSLTQLPW